MNKKRISYILFSLLTIILPILTTSVVLVTLDNFLHILLILIIFFFTYFLFLINMKEKYDIGLFGAIKTLRYKKIYYSQIGYFYLNIIDDDHCDIYEQCYFGMVKKFGTVYYDLEDLRSKIKNKIEIIYKEELKKENKRMALINWDGNIDIASERDDKLNKILK